MFARLKQHSVALENDIQTLQKTLDTKLKLLFSIAETKPSEQSIEYFEKLIAELRNMENVTARMVRENQECKRITNLEYKKYWKYIQELSSQLEEMENYLEGFGYIKDPIKLSFIENNEDLRVNSYVGLEESVNNLNIDENSD